MDGLRMKSTIVKFKDKDTVSNLRAILERLLETKLVQALLVPMILPGKNGYVQSLITDPEKLKDANPLAPTMPVQSARILSDLTSSPSQSLIGAVLKPCEMRAVVELEKFLQVNLDNILIIGVDCLGTYEVKDYAELAERDKEFKAKINPEVFKEGVMSPGEGPGFREACRICDYPASFNADLTFGFFGYDPGKEMALIVSERFEKEIQEKLSFRLKEESLTERERIIQKIITERKKERSRILNELKERTGSPGKLMEILSTCIRCHNCMNVCPICYCKECLFESSVFEHRADQFLGWSGRKGAIRLPTDTLLFHLTRMSHMAASCISCGMCESACPNHIPISRLFALMGGELQAMFAYVPGLEPAAEPPVTVFKESELQAETGARD